jgi:hypothetical protein
MTDQSPAEVLRVVAQLLLDMADAADEDVDTNPYWRSEREPREHWFANGIDDACGGPAGWLASMFNPATARALAATFRAWVDIGELDPNQLHRAGCEETVDVARQLLATAKEFAR